MTQPSEPTLSPSDMNADNGILCHVPAQYIGRAQQALPDAALVPDDEICVEVDAGWLGRVRLTFRKYRYSRPYANCPAVAWSCRHAERVGLAAPQLLKKTEPNLPEVGLDRVSAA